MLLLLISSTLAGPMGPAAATMTAHFGLPSMTTDGEIETAPCEEAFPYALTQVPLDTDLTRVFQPPRSYGTPVLIEALMEASGRVAAAYPDAEPVFIGDLSTSRGGALPPHRWHHDGRSADIGLFSNDGVQPTHGFEPVWSKNLDVEKTWALIDALLETGQIEHILIDQAHVKRLKAYVAQNGLMSPEEIQATFPNVDTPRIWAMHGIVRHAPSHGDHMHVRVLCPTDR